MDIQELQKFSRQEHARLQKYYSVSKPEDLHLPITIKIMEELGELCNEVLAHSGLQRKEKLQNFNKEDIEEEFADVILTTFNLAQSMGIDVEPGLSRKMKKIEKRYAP